MLLKWHRGITLPQDPNAIVDYEIDFTKWLAAEGSITSVTAVAVGCTVNQPDEANNIVQFRVSDLEQYSCRVTLHLTAADGQEADFSIRFIMATQ